MFSFVHEHTTIRRKYMILFHLFFLLCAIIRPKIRVHTDLFLLLVHDHLTKIYGLLSFFLLWISIWPFVEENIWSSFIYSFFCAWPFDKKLGSSLIYFFLFVHDNLTKIYDLLSFIYYFFSARPFDQILGSPLTYCFYFYTTIWQS